MNTVTVDTEEKLSAVLEEMETFSKLPSNWDGYGAVAVHGASIELAKKILLLSYMRNLSAKIEDVQPNPNGTLSIIWENNGNEVMMEVGDKAFSYYATINGETSYFSNLAPTSSNTHKLSVQLLGLCRLHGARSESCWSGCRGKSLARQQGTRQHCASFSPSHW